MAYIILPPAFRIPEREATPERLYWAYGRSPGPGRNLRPSRRDALRALGLSAAGLGLLACRRGFSQPAAKPTHFFTPQAGVKRSGRYTLDRPLTDEAIAATYNNFYEFTTDKEDVARLSRRLTVRPWTLEITGLVEKPLTLGLEDLVKKMPLEERLYRHRCVEAWSMAVPWIGFPLRELIKLAKPKAEARYVRFVSLARKDEMPGIAEQPWYPWPYFEGLRMDEAMNELSFLVTGVYGHDLPAQHGAPLRLAVPWKYGYKSPKSIVKIEFVRDQPETFWHLTAPLEYGFESNVDPAVPHPRWSQATERVLGTGARRPTLPYNGYGALVAHLYKDRGAQRP